MIASADIDTRVSEVLAEALNVPASAIKPAATLHGDLGAESIDILDIVFRLEREFGVPMVRGELFPEAIFQGGKEFVQNGTVTSEGLDLLRTRMPFADLTGLERDRRLTFIPELVTVDLLSRYVAWKLEHRTT